jgi:hypothetical protein
LSRCSPQQRISADRQRVAESRRALDLHLDHLLTLQGEHLRGSALRLHALSPLVTLGRGFAVVRRQSDGGLVASVAQVSIGQGLQIQVADGAFAAVAGPRMDAEPPDVAAPPASVGASQRGGRRRHTDPVASAGADLLSDDGRDGRE